MDHPVVTLGQDLRLGSDPRGERRGKVLPHVGRERLRPIDLWPIHCN